MDIQKFVTDFFKQADPVGLLLYTMGTITVTTIQLVNRKEFIRGLKGDNGRFDSPEIVIYLFIWIFPHFLMADAWLSLKLSTEGYLFLTAMLLFTLTGRWGLEWLLKLKGGGAMTTTTTKSSSNEEIKTKVTTEGDQDKVS